MEPYDVIVNQPVVIDNVSRWAYYSYWRKIFFPSPDESSALNKIYQA